MAYTNTTTNRSDEIMTYYSAKFLERSKEWLIHREGLQKSRKSKGSGMTTLFNRLNPLPKATTPLTQGQNPAEVSIGGSTVTVTLAEYGTTVKISRLLKLTSIDVDAEEKVEVVGQNMGETLDELARDAMFSGATPVLAGGKSALSSIAASDTLSATEIRRAVRQLKKNKALRYPDGYFLGKIGPDTSMDLMGDPAWTNVNVYNQGGKAIYNGEVGRLHGVRFVETTNQKSESSTVSVYSNFIHGQKAIGEYDLEGDMPKLYIKVPTSGDTSNPADRYSTISWAGAYVAKVLIGDWVLNLKTGATA